MKQISLPQSHEQRRVEELLVKLAKIHPISTKAAPIAVGRKILRSA
jgi:hypothetical protein